MARGFRQRRTAEKRRLCAANWRLPAPRRQLRKHGSSCVSAGKAPPVQPRVFFHLQKSAARRRFPATHCERRKQGGSHIPSKKIPARAPRVFPRLRKATTLRRSPTPHCICRKPSGSDIPSKKAPPAQPKVFSHLRKVTARRHLLLHTANVEIQAAVYALNPKKRRPRSLKPSRICGKPQPSVRSLTPHCKRRKQYSSCVSAGKAPPTQP